jgi:hypothetical protein
VSVVHILRGRAAKHCEIVLELVTYENPCDIVKCYVCILRSGNRADILCN